MKEVYCVIPWVKINPADSVILGLLKNWALNDVILSKFIISFLLSFNCVKATTKPTPKPTTKPTTKPPKPKSTTKPLEVCDWPVGTCSHFKEPCPPYTERCPNHDKGCKIKTNLCCCYKYVPPSKLFILNQVFPCTWETFFSSYPQINRIASEITKRMN